MNTVESKKQILVQENTKNSREKLEITRSCKKPKIKGKNIDSNITFESIYVP